MKHRGIGQETAINNENPGPPKHIQKYAVSFVLKELATVFFARGVEHS